MYRGLGYAEVMGQGKGSMTKSELIEALAKAEGITLRAAEQVVQVTLESMTRAVARGDRVEIRGFWPFKVKGYDGYSGRNPKTGEKLHVKDKRLPFFKVGKELRARVNGGEEERRL